MCEAEEQLWRVERDIERLGDRLDRLAESILDCDRGLIDMEELRRLANAEIRGVKL